MKTTFALLVTLFATASAFAPSAKSTLDTRLFDGKINPGIDPDSAKVVTMEQLQSGEKKVYCRCWQSGTWPLCDAAHVAHNKETGDNVGPLIVSVPKAKEE